MKYAYLHREALAHAAVAVTIIFDVVAYVWHGLLRQPSIIDLIHPGFWSNPVLLFAGLVSTVVGAYVAGHLFAWWYNWHVNKYASK